MNADQGSARKDLMMAFLARAGWGAAEIAPLAGDASQRRYLRLLHGMDRAVLMDAPPDKGEDVRPFVAVGAWLQDQGLSSPQTYAADMEHGFLLIEDLGDTLYSRHIPAEPADETLLYGQAIRVLTTLAECEPPTSIGTGEASRPLPAYDRSTLLRESDLAPEWYVPAARGAKLPPDLREEFTELVAAAVASVADVRSTVVLRDYHAENLLWLPARAGLARVGLIDYQDAIVGHAAYDLVSLLEDARRDTTPDLRAAMMDFYLAGRPELNHEMFKAAYATLGAQRNLKIIGIFARLALRDGKPGYLKLIPRVWDHLQTDLAHPALAPLAAWIARHVPAPEPRLLAAIEGASR